MRTQTGLPMSWSEWFALDGVDLADLIRKGKITTNEVIAQTTAGVQRVDGELEGVLELFVDVLQKADSNSPIGQAPYTACQYFSKILAPVWQNVPKNLDLVYCTAISRMIQDCSGRFLVL